jgi:hypothetical protein
MEEITLFIKRKNKEGAKRTDNFQLLEIGINVTDEKQEVQWSMNACFTVDVTY